MKALVKYASGEGNIGIRDVAEPICGDDNVKLEIAFCGVCGTDIHVLHDTFRNFPAGTVAEAGKNVQGIKRSERVAGLGATSVTCGHCRYCRSGYFVFCSNRRRMGPGVNGAFTRYALLRSDQVHRVRKHFSLEEAAMSEPSFKSVRVISSDMVIFMYSKLPTLLRVAHEAQ